MQINISLIIDTIYSILMVFTPALSYLPQYYLMDKNRTCGTFSNLVCYFLLLSHILRIIFWFGTTYRFSIFLQSVAVIILQIFVLSKYFEIETERAAEASSKKGISKYHNNANAIFMLLSHLLALTYVYFAIFTFFRSSFLIHVTGSLSAIFEGLIAIPQFFSNYKAKSVESLRLSKKSHYGYFMVSW